MQSGHPCTRDKEQGLTSSIVTHAEFGSVTLAFHLLSYWGVDAAVFSPWGALPWVLRHILDPAAPNAAEEAARPTLLKTISRASIVSKGALQSEELLNVFWPQLRVLCPCVFKQSGWAYRHITARKHLRAFDTPLALDDALLGRCRERLIRSLLPQSITPLVASAMFHAMWMTLGGGNKAR
jgi:hypothetical protein